MKYNGAPELHHWPIAFILVMCFLVAGGHLDQSDDGAAQEAAGCRRTK